MDVCQSDVSRIRRELGALPDTIDCPTSVGGLPGRGVPEAIEKLQTAIKAGAKWFVRSDLQNFFTKIPKPKIEQFLTENIADKAFVLLFMEALATELSNEDEIRADLDLFPTGDEGVPQGSALSALCANIILSAFDSQLNGRGVTTIRYLDDFVILAPTKAAAEKAWSSALKLLSEVGLSAHDPEKQTGKASKGEVTKGFDFLSFSINDHSAVPSKEAQTKLLENIRKVIREAKKGIEKTGANPRRAQPMFAQSLVLIDKKIRGWGDAFRPTTQRVMFAQLDDQIEPLVNNFIAWFGRQTKRCDRRARMRKIGLALLVDTDAAVPIN